jgi:hypothetical protein
MLNGIVLNTDMLSGIVLNGIIQYVILINDAAPSQLMVEISPNFSISFFFFSKFSCFFCQDKTSGQ